MKSLSFDLNTKLWRFARGESDTTKFEAWAYSEPALELQLSSNLYLHIIGCDFSDQEAVWKCRKAVWDHLQNNKKCECGTICDNDTVRLHPMNDHNFVTWNYNLWAGTQTSNTDSKNELAQTYISECEICSTRWRVVKNPRAFEVTQLSRIQDGNVDDMI